MTEDIRIFNNKNGYLEIDEFLTMIHNNQIEEYIQYHRVTTHKCMPIRLKSDNIGCFYCMDCYRNAEEQIREFRDFYKVKGKKYMKEDLKGQMNLLNMGELLGGRCNE